MRDTNNLTKNAKSDQSSMMEVASWCFKWIGIGYLWARFYYKPSTLQIVQMDVALWCYKLIGNGIGMGLVSLMRQELGQLRLESMMT